MMVISHIVWKVWPLAALYPLREQRLLHQSLYTAYLAWQLFFFMRALMGRATWGLFRTTMLIEGSVNAIGLICLHVLEGGGLRRPTHECHLVVCDLNDFDSDTVAEAWVMLFFYWLGFWLAATPLSQERLRRAVGRHTGLSHVRLDLGELGSLGRWGEASFDVT